MKYTIKSEADKVESEVTLSLKIDGDGECGVVTIDSDGDEITLAEFTKKGKLRVMLAVSEDLGFDLDDDDRIVVEKEV